MRNDAPTLRFDADGRRWEAAYAGLELHGGDTLLFWKIRPDGDPCPVDEVWTRADDKFWRTTVPAKFRATGLKELRERETVDALVAA
mgnify:CR=1 FL=1